MDDGRFFMVERTLGEADKRGRSDAPSVKSVQSVVDRVIIPEATRVQQAFSVLSVLSV